MCSSTALLECWQSLLSEQSLVQSESEWHSEPLRFLEPLERLNESECLRSTHSTTPSHRVVELDGSKWFDSWRFSTWFGLSKKKAIKFDSVESHIDIDRFNSVRVMCLKIVMIVVIASLQLMQVVLWHSEFTISIAIPNSFHDIVEIALNDDMFIEVDQSLFVFCSLKIKILKVISVFRAQHLWERRTECEQVVFNWSFNIHGYRNSLFFFRLKLLIIEEFIITLESVIDEELWYFDDELLVSRFKWYLLVSIPPTVHESIESIEQRHNIIKSLSEQDVISCSMFRNPCWFTCSYIAMNWDELRCHIWIDRKEP